MILLVMGMVYSKTAVFFQNTGCLKKSSITNVAEIWAKMGGENLV